MLATTLVSNEAKIVFVIIATIFEIVAFFPYFRDMLLKKTQPHAYSWLIWSLTLGTAMAGAWYGGGGLGVVGPAVGVVLVFAVFVLSLRYGTKNITLGDTMLLIGALCGVVMWWIFNSPILSVIIVTTVDVVGYIPTWRKSFKEPWSETINTWVMWCIGNSFSILALSAYNLLTLTYLVSITSANLILIAVCLARRRYIPKP